jgi:plastocyanin
MLRLLYLLLRQRLHGRAPLRFKLPVVAAVAVPAALLVCAIAWSYLRVAPADPTAAASEKASLKLRVDAIGSAPLVVFLESAGPPSPTKSVSGTARITSVNAAFEPAFQVATVGTEIEVSNRDPIPHNTHLFTDAGRTLFNVATPSSELRVRKAITRAGIFDVRCDLHPWMRASVFVPPGAHHAVLWAPGEVTLPGIAPGRYRLHVWERSRGDAARTLVFAAGDTVSLVH